MELFDSLNQLPVPQMEPVAHLSRYLDGLNVSAALESFNRLAEALALPAEQASSSFATQFLDPSSPTSSSTSGSWSSSNYNSSELGSPSSRSSSSFGGSSSSSKKRAKAREKALFQKSNASAAERYRRKVRGINCTLTDQLFKEERRNLKLISELEVKLALYREFLSLLSNKLESGDRQLASAGLRSAQEVGEILNCEQSLLTSPECQRFKLIIENTNSNSTTKLAQSPMESQGFFEVSSSDYSNLDNLNHSRRRVELENLLSLSVGQANGQLVYDFYLDSFVDSKSQSSS